MSHARPRLGLHSLVLAIVMLLAGAVSAHATTVDVASGTLVVTGGDNLNHELQFRLNGGNDEVYDVHGITTSTCVNDGTMKVICPGSGNLQVNLGSGDDDVTFVSQGFDCFDAYELNLGDGANTLNLSGDCGPTLPGGATTVNAGSGPDVLTAGSQGPITFNAGGGNDSVYATPANDLIHGGEGDDRLFGYGGNDQVLGEGGADQLNGGSENDNVDGGTGDDGLEHCSNCIGSGNDPGVGADNYIGGDGADRLWLDAHAAGMTISIDGQPNDGSSGEGDNVGSDIEEIVGTVHADVFTGRPAPTTSPAAAATTRSTAPAATTTCTAAATTTGCSVTPATTRSRARAGPTASMAARAPTRCTGTSPPALCSARSTPTRWPLAMASGTPWTAVEAPIARSSISWMSWPSACRSTGQPSGREEASPSRASPARRRR